MQDSNTEVDDYTDPIRTAIDAIDGSTGSVNFSGAPVGRKIRPGLACLPMKIDDCFPASDPKCWFQPEPLAAQYGCGGLRMRLSCEPGQTLFGRAPGAANARPALVQ